MLQCSVTNFHPNEGAGKLLHVVVMEPEVVDFNDMWIRRLGATDCLNSNKLRLNVRIVSDHLESESLLGK